MSGHPQYFRMPMLQLANYRLPTGPLGNTAPTKKNIDGVEGLCI